MTSTEWTTSARLSFEELGTGVPVLAIHGWRPDHRLMTGCLEPVFATRPGYRRLYPDLPGMGRSPAGSELIARLAPAEATEFTGIAVVQSRETLARFRAGVAAGIAIADMTALARVRARWSLSVAPETGPPYERPVLILTGRQDSSTGYAEQYTLLDHCPRASYVVLDRAGHNLQFEQPGHFSALVREWLDRVEEDAAARKPLPIA